MNSSSLHASGSFKSAQQTFSLDLFQPLRKLIHHTEVKNSRVARRIARLIPAQCPFERDVVLFGRHVAHIPPLCKLNPLYEELVELRFKALCYLADECGEDISAYI
ncbi:MAG TPA: Mo-dependent nitrogenase C-terminal domain-containing protein [Trichocoleus sp.]